MERKWVKKIKRKIFKKIITKNKRSDIFPNTPIILMAQDNKGVPTYQGRKDIVNFLVNIDINQIPWKEYTVS